MVPSQAWISGTSWRPTDTWNFTWNQIPERNVKTTCQKSGELPFYLFWGCNMGYLGISLLNPLSNHIDLASAFGKLWLLVKGWCHPVKTWHVSIFLLQLL